MFCDARLLWYNVKLYRLLLLLLIHFNLIFYIASNIYDYIPNYYLATLKVLNIEIAHLNDRSFVNYCALVKDELRVPHYELRVPLKARVGPQNTSCELPHLASNDELKSRKCELQETLASCLIMAATNVGVQISVI